MKIACIGNSTCDCTVSSDCFLVENKKFSFDNAQFTIGGPASNAASVITNFGGAVDFYGQIGRDFIGKKVYEDMVKEKIDMSHISVSDRLQTPFSFIHVNTKSGSRTISSTRSPEDFKKSKIENFEPKIGYDFILTDGKYAEDSIELIKANPTATSIIDAGRVNDEVIGLCKVIDYIVCSQEFADGITGGEINQDYENNARIYNKMKEIFPDATGIVITIGEHGYICEENGKVVIKPSYNSGLPAIDTNCAGDIFHGAFTYAMASGYDYHVALEFANVTASLSTTKHGGRKSCPKREEVEAALSKMQLSEVNNLKFQKKDA